ncbi:chromate transporter [Azohydromonas aeria]|uniref:chromate transporter n=1 Tax=Azohydromonas aeria TaxID=2590212 RepID=UPI0012FA2DB8|nr:chromate transporter [Azohydromonas aeria]
MSAGVVLGPADWVQLLLHFMMLSLLSVGGAIATTPEMHRFLVREHGYLSSADFSQSIAIAQAAPGPNVLFVAVLGWHVGGTPGAIATMAGILLPSSVLTLALSHWSSRRRDSREVRAFTGGMAPLTVALLLSTGWLLSEPAHGHLGAMALVIGSAVVAWRFRISPMWLVAAGAVAGALGLA